MNNIERDVFIYASLLAEHGDNLIRTPILEAFLRRFYLTKYRKLGKASKYVFDKAIKQINKAQSDINLADAQSKAGGISGMLQRSWRPLIGMSCALAIFWEYVLKQFLM